MRWTSETKPKGGRKPGSRNKLCRAVLEDLMADWAEGGAAAIKMMRIEQPAAYVRVMCSILPKELIFENSTITELDDAELDHMIEMLRERALAARQEQAGARKGPGTKAVEWTTLTNSMQTLARLEAERERRLAEKIEAGRDRQRAAFRRGRVRIRGARPGRASQGRQAGRAARRRRYRARWCST